MFEILTSSQAWLAAGLIFFMRIIEMALDTIRVLMVMRNRKSLAWVLGFFQATIFVFAIGSVLSDLSSPIKLIGYAAGFATGTVVGMYIEERLAIGHIHLNIISPTFGTAVAEEMRSEGYAITEIPARGKDGMVTMLSCSVRRRDVYKVRRIVNRIDATAFITTEDIQPIRRGFWGA